MARCGKGAGQAGQEEQEDQTEQVGWADMGGRVGQAGPTDLVDQAGAGRTVCGDVIGDDEECEEAVLDEVVESALDCLADEGRAVFDDDFIRSRRALNALKGRPAVAADPDIDIDIDDEGPEDGLTEEIIGSQTMWCGKFLSVEDVKVRLPNGRVAHRDVVRHPGAVAVIALTNEGKLVLVHQYRTSLEQVTLEIPAGKLNPGEDPARAAARELAEETGYKAARMAYLGPVAVAAGYSDEIIHMYLAMGLTFVGASPDDDEFLHVDLVDLGEMVDRVLDGKVVDSKTIIGVMLCDAISRRMEA